MLFLVATVLATGQSQATFAGKDGRISFTALAGRSLEIFSANPDGSDPERLTKTPGNRVAVISEWSPDGEMIAYDSDAIDDDGRRNVVQIYTMNADGSDQTQLTRGPGFHGFPGWSPDGTSIAIDADWGGKRALQGIWIIPASAPDGVRVDEALRVTKIPAAASFDSEPQYSPDGNSIVFARYKSASKSAIHRVNVDGTGLKRLTSYGLNASDPDWSPNGKLITFDSGDAGRRGSKGDIYVMRADGSKEKALTDTKPASENSFDLVNNPVWSPSGSKIMYTQFSDEGSSLAVMNANGTRPRAIDLPQEFINKVDWGVHP